VFINTILYGKIEVPDTEEEVLKEIEKYKSFYEKYPDRYKQVMIDALEERLDMFRRDENV
jgi:hypothetical protein